MDTDTDIAALLSSRIVLPTVGLERPYDKDTSMHEGELEVSIKGQRLRLLYSATITCELRPV